MTAPTEPSDAYRSLTETIRNRATHKVLSTSGNPIDYSGETLAEGDRLLSEMLATAGWAPFHYARNVDGVAEPWRFYWLRNSACRQLASLSELTGLLKPHSKFGNFLNSCCSAVVCCWIPQEKTLPEEKIDAKKLAQINEEHLAATCCAVQNLLLLCQSVNWKSYWSSGRILDDPALRKKLEIPANRKIIGAVFVQYSVGQIDGTEALAGKLRPKRSEPQQWLTCLENLS